MDITVKAQEQLKTADPKVFCYLLRSSSLPQLRNMSINDAKGLSTTTRQEELWFNKLIVILKS